MSRANALSVEGWRPLYDICSARADEVQRDLKQFLAAELSHLEREWPRRLPQGVIHADLFPDNVFFLGNKLSGLIDFYFACTDALAYDVAICLNAWCFETDHSYNVTKGRGLLSAYMQVRPLSRRGACRTAAARPRRRPALSADAAGRLARRSGRSAGASEGSARILSQAALSPDGEGDAGLRDRSMSEPHVVIHTDGACSGNPGPGGWGAILAFGRAPKGDQGRRDPHDQQPHGADGGDRRAGSAQQTLPGRYSH